MKSGSDKIVLQSHIVPGSAERSRFSEYAIGLFPPLNSRNAVKKTIKKGRLLLNGITAQTGSWVTPGSTIDLISDTENPGPEYRLELKKLYEDDHIAVIMKPAGVPVNGNFFKTIENALPFSLLPSTAEDALSRPMPLHRLDSRTSGLLLAAKTSSAMKELGLQFENRAVKKRYRAVVTGEIRKDGIINSPIDGRAALTVYKPVRTAPSLKYGYLTLVDLFPETGRTHQIRIHLSAIGHPILGDNLYGTGGSILRGKGLFLCAVEHSFIHPLFRTPLSVSINHPAKFNSIMIREQMRLRKDN